MSDETRLEIAPTTGNSSLVLLSVGSALVARGRNDAAALMASEGDGLSELRHRAEKGHPEAQYDLGIAYYEGRGLGQDHAEAARWFRKAADQGDGASCIQLSLMYATGQGVCQDYSEAVRWCRKVAERGVAICQTALGGAYAKGNGVSQDYTEAARWYRRAANQRYADAQCALGQMYEEGNGVPQDLARALMWLKLAVAHAAPDEQADYATHRDSCARKMTAEQISEAQLLAREWEPYQDPEDS